MQRDKKNDGSKADAEELKMTNHKNTAVVDRCVGV